MVTIKNNLIPFKGFAAINICGIVFVRRGVTIDDRMKRHESIHTRQMLELLIVFFYLWYEVEWIVKCIKYRSARIAYRNVSFEREAYANQDYILYTDTRGTLAFLEYV